MGELRLPGLATGIDTATLIDQMMIINSRRLASYQVKKISYETQNTALEDLKGKVTSLESATAALSDADDLEIFSSSTSDSDILKLSTTSQANTGSHSIETNQLATTETWIQDTSTFDFETDYVGGGTFIYSYNNKERTITSVEDVTTLEDFVNLINNDEDNPGVTASLLNQGGKYHLMLSGQETGQDYRISVNESSTEVWQSDIAFTLESDSSQNAGLTTKITELAQFGAVALGGGEKIQITGADHFGNSISPTPFDLNVTSNTTVAHVLAAIEDAFDGNVKATLEEGNIVVTDTTSGTSLMSIAMTYDDNSTGSTLTLPTMAFSAEGDATSESLTSLDSSTFIQTQIAQNSQIKVDGYPSSAPTSEVQTLTPSPLPTNAAETYTLTYMGQTTAAIASDATYAEIQSALEALSTVNTDDIIVSGAFTDGLKDGAVTFTFDDSLGDVASILVDSSSLVTPGAVAVTVAESIKGISDYINRNSNSISDALTGITLNLQAVTDPGESIEITITRNTGAVTSKVQSLVATYNALIDAINKNTKYDSEAKAMGILSNNMAVTFLAPQMQNYFQSVTDGFVDTIDSFVQSSDIGLTIDGAGKLKFDDEIFDDAVNEDFLGVLELLGATGAGNSTSSVVQFYGASDEYTTPGIYEVEVDIAGNEVTEARFRVAGEATWRIGTLSSYGAIITGDSTFDDDSGGPLYGENGLQVSVDLTQADGTYSATVRVKQGLIGSLEDMLKEVLKSDGQFDASKEVTDDRITNMESRIKNEEKRLTLVETRLIAKYARLERILTEMSQQMAAATSAVGAF